MHIDSYVLWGAKTEYDHRKILNIHNFTLATPYEGWNGVEIDFR